MNAANEIDQEISPTALMIQDFPSDQLESMRELLSHFGIEVSVAVYGQDGLDTAAAKPPDLIISDIALPDMSGIELCRKIRAHPKLSTIPVLLVSGLRSDSDPVVACLKAGANDYLRIPYDPMRLLVKTNRLIERGRAEEASRQREKFFRLLIENSTDNITFLDQDGVTLYESPSVERIMGYTQQEMIGHNNFHLIHPDDLPGVMAAFRKVLEQDEIASPVEFRVRHKDGSWRVLESMGRRLRGESGRVLAVANTRDITERKQAEEQLKKREAQLAETQRLAHIGSFEWDLGTSEWTWSDELFRILGLEPQSVQASEALLSDHLSNQGKETVLTSFEKAVVDHQPFTIKHAIVRADGSIRVAQTRGQAVLGRTGETVKLIGTLQDITDVK